MTSGDLAYYAIWGALWGWWGVRLANYLWDSPRKTVS